MRDRLDELIRRHRAAGSIRAHFDVDDLAVLVFSLIPGFLLQRMLLDEIDPATYARGLRAILRAGPCRPG